ncbi:NADPH2:quinone reductase [Agrobacterium fabrum]|uniref:NADPH2:quinone reductase n=1 Tax=Agrobacterium fabrum TaxID=1176649 RepID=A0A7Z7BRZ7_9HYPH|nr:alcohol dehydrogenase catalytic domain-containing protein [Agrobacterium fabrum]SDK35259.1 NADPH2:quinone reductase [Agrobacterium fabrum]
MSQTKGFAVQIDRYGPPEVLVCRDIDLLPLAPREVRIQTLMAAVNHTDLEIRAGNWPVRKQNPFPYVPGVEVVGTVVEMGSAVSEWTVGETVTTMMQGLGGVKAERDGGYAEFVTVDADTLALVPPSVNVAELAALGLVGVTAYEGLKRLGPLEGRRVLITGAAGGVGSAATAIAKALGASVTGLVSRSEQMDYVRGLGAERVEVARGGPLPFPSGSYDGVLDVVGGDLFGPCVNALRDGGVFSLVGAVGGGRVTFDAWHLIRPVTLTGYSTESLDGAGLRHAISDLCDWLASGEVCSPKYRIISMQDASKAHETLERGGVEGRLLLAPTIIQTS